MTSRGRQRATAAHRQTGVTTFLYDLRHAARALRHHSGFLAVVVLTLGFGIGINTATFSIVNAVLIRPLPFDQPGRLVALTERVSGFADNAPFSPPDFIDLQREQQSFDGDRGLRATSGRAVREWHARADRRLQGVVEPVRRAWDPSRCWDVRSRSKRTVRAWTWPYSATSCGRHGLEPTDRLSAARSPSIAGHTRLSA